MHEVLTCINGGGFSGFFPIPQLVRTGTTAALLSLLAVSLLSVFISLIGFLWGTVGGGSLGGGGSIFLLGIIFVQLYERSEALDFLCKLPVGLYSMV